jgi:hypothetical protein
MVQEEPKPYTGLAWLLGRTVRRRDRALRGQQFLNSEGGLVIGGRHLHHGQARQRHMRVIDLPHTWHDVPTPPEVLPSERLHPTGDGYARGLGGCQPPLT